MKKYIQRSLLLFCGGFFILGLTPFDGSICFKVNAAQKNRQRKSVKQTKREASKSSAFEIAKRREEINQLMLDGKYQHDGSLELFYIGDMSSVPALLRVLKDNPTGRMNGQYVYKCTTAHALTTLRKITNQNAGMTYEEWNAWWEQYRSTQPGNSKTAA